jgi:hypothetical protein
MGGVVQNDQDPATPSNNYKHQKSDGVQNKAKIIIIITTTTTTTTTISSSSKQSISKLQKHKPIKPVAKLKLKLCTLDLCGFHLSTHYVLKRFSPNYQL